MAKKKIASHSRIILAVFSDTHAGFRLGLMNPDVVLYDETEDGELVPYKPRPTASQKYLWKLYQEQLKELQNIADGDPIYGLHNGDLTQGNKHRTGMVSTRDADQILIAAANLRPFLDIPNVIALRMAAGTEAHNFGQGSADILVNQTLKSEYGAKNIGVVYHGLLNVHGVLVDYAHHGPFPGSREWLKGNVARLYLRDLLYREIIAGNAPPRLVFRSHYHQYIKVTDEIGEHTSTLMITPSYCMLGDYAHQAARSPDRITNGMIAVEIKDGRVKDIYPLVKTIDIRTKEAMV